MEAIACKRGGKLHPPLAHLWLWTLMDKWPSLPACLRTLFSLFVSPFTQPSRTILALTWPPCGPFWVPFWVHRGDYLSITWMGITNNLPLPTRRFSTFIYQPIPYSSGPHCSLTAHHWPMSDGAQNPTLYSIPTYYIFFAHKEIGTN